MSIEISFLVRDGSQSSFPALSAGIPSDLNPCRPCACHHSFSGFMCVSVLAARHCFLDATLPACSFTLSTSSSSQLLKVWGEGFPTKDWAFLSLRIAQLLVSILVPIYCKKKLLRWWLSEALTHVYRRVSLGVILLLCNQNRAHEQSCGNSEYLREHFKKTKQKSCYSVSSKHEKLLKCIFVLPCPPGVSERRGLFQMAHYYLLSVIRVRLPFVCVYGKLCVCHAWLVFGI